jgi:hypothetical protein
MTEENKAKADGIMKKLEGLYKLAILKDGEEKDESRRIEAASSALLLLNLARKNGVKLRFVHGEEDEKEQKKKKEEQDAEWWMRPLETFVTEASKRALKDIVKDLSK